MRTEVLSTPAEKESAAALGLAAPWASPHSTLVVLTQCVTTQTVSDTAKCAFRGRGESNSQLRTTDLKPMVRL